MKYIHSDKFIPVGGRLLVKPPPSFTEKVTKSGIILAFPLSEEGYYRLGEVIAVDCHDDRNDKIDVGDHILFDRYYKEDLIVGGQEAILVRREDVYGVVKLSSIKKD